MEQNILTTILALIIYLSTSLFGGNNKPVDPQFPATKDNKSSQSDSVLLQTAVISTDIVNMRAEPTTNSSVIRKLTKGSDITINQEKDGWYKISDDQGNSGWIVTWAAKPTYFAKPPTTNKKEVVGYYAESYRGDSRALQSFAGNTDKITTIAPFLYQVDKNGNISGQNKSQLTQTANTKGIKVLAVVTNIKSSNFSKEVISTMLRNKSARSRTISRILRLIKEEGYSGVNIDFEGVPSRDRPYLTAFFRELASVLRSHNYLVTAALPAKTAKEEWSSWSGAFDYQAIAPYLDMGIIMTYDQHYAKGPAGPVASQEWVENVLRYSLRHFPPQKLVMGIAAYGYVWNNRSGKALNYSAIESLITQYKVTPKWHDHYQTPYFTYTKSGVKHEVWYENRYSTAAKMKLVNKYNLRGIALWRLGYEDPGIWKVF